MSLRLEMLQVARLAPNLLADATPRVVAFLEGGLNDDGGGADREGKSDLYYTAFVLDGLLALQAELPRDRVRSYLASFGHGEDLDLVHKACLVRCWAALDHAWPSADFPARMMADFEAHRSRDGGYAMEPGAEQGTLYDAFLALGMYQDLAAMPPETDALLDSFAPLRSDDGGYGNSMQMPWGTTPSTSAAAAVHMQLGRPVPPRVGEWLLEQQHPAGGFKAMPEAPLPDLLSTATALHALGSMGITLGERREITLDFVDSLWNGQAFHGHWEDDIADVEYLFYGLLALGHLSLLS